MSKEWNQKDLVEEYATSADDPTKNWYEAEVNIPSIIKLVGNKVSSVLDFGCGPGGLTVRLAEDYTAVGADASELMIQKARATYPEVEFFVWDGLRPLPTDKPLFDCIVTKLTLEFVDDIKKVAENLHRALAKGGILVVSVAHPMLVAHFKPEDPYFETSSSKSQIGATGIVVTKLQRSLQDYINPFLESGFRLDRIDEPTIPAEISERHGAKPADLQIPKRLNLKFTA
jgi:SAM-dependent methyltransferase